MVNGEKLKQTSTTGKIRPQVSIISMTNSPIGTLFAVWHNSRRDYMVNPQDIQSIYSMAKELGDDRLFSLPDLPGIQQTMIDQVNLTKRLLQDYPEHAAHGGVYNVIKTVVSQSIEADVPASESVNFVIEVENASVAWREQLVRSKMASYWTQSTRVMDMTTMDINMNDSVELLGGPEAVKIYEDTANTIREAYTKLEKLGVPSEDIRLQPQQHIHRVCWMVSLRTLIKVLNKRSDWIAQASLWTPIISGVCKELRKVSLFDIVQKFVGNPPVKVSQNPDTGEYYVSEYVMNADKVDRYYGHDPLPCDPLFLAYNQVFMPEHTPIEFYDYMKSLFINIWSDDYLKVLHWDRAHPEKIGPYDRPYSWFKEHNLLGQVTNLSQELRTE